MNKDKNRAMGLFLCSLSQVLQGFFLYEPLIWSHHFPSQTFYPFENKPLAKWNNVFFSSFPRLFVTGSMINSVLTKRIYKKHHYIPFISLKIRPLHLNHLDCLKQFKNWLISVSLKNIYIYIATEAKEEVILS